MGLENLAKIVSFSFPIRDVDSLAHVTFRNEETRKEWNADMSVERLVEKINLRNLVNTMDEEQIKLLELYLKSLKDADDEDSKHD